MLCAAQCERKEGEKIARSTIGARYSSRPMNSAPVLLGPHHSRSAAGSGERFDNSLVRRLDFQALYLSVALAANYSFTRSQTCRMWPLPGSDVNAEGLGFPTGAQQARL